jgi:hypothetical protein
MRKDPIVAEVRKHRKKRAAKFAYDLRAIAEDAKKREPKGRRKRVSSASRSPVRPDVPRKGLYEAYKQMSQDEAREAEALEWADATAR